MVSPSTTFNSCDLTWLKIKRNNNESLSSYLVRSGYAFAYRRYSKKFIPDEDYARINTIGMWSMKFDYPWDYRKSKKN